MAKIDFGGVMAFPKVYVNGQRMKSVKINLNKHHESFMKKI